MRWRLEFLLALPVVLAGCAAPRSDEGLYQDQAERDRGGDLDPTANPSPLPPPPNAVNNATDAVPPALRLSFTKPLVALAGCEFACFESTVAVDGAGRVFVADGDRIARSLDGGSTFEQVPLPPLPQGAPEGSTGADTVVTADPQGRLVYYTPLVNVNAGCVLCGIHVAVSDDGGESWSSNVFVSLLAESRDAAFAMDRPWLGFGPGETVYLSYNNAASGIWISRSDDGARSFGPFNPVSQADGSIRPTAAGPPSVDREGHVFLPFFGLPSTSAVATGQGLEALVVADSFDGGRTFRYTSVASALPPSEPGGWFPILAVDDDMNLHLAWNGGDGGILVSSSTDKSATWTLPVRWSGERTAAISPWIRATDGRLDVLWFESAGEEEFALVFGRAPLATAPRGGGIERVEIAPVRGDFYEARGVVPNSDFANFAVGSDGRVIAVWSDAGTQGAYVAFELGAKV